MKQISSAKPFTCLQERKDGKWQGTNRMMDTMLEEEEDEKWVENEKEEIAYTGIPEVP